MEAITIETTKFSYGKFKDTLFEITPIMHGAVLKVSYAKVDYPDGYRNGKQNHAVMTATSGAAVSIDIKGRMELLGNAEDLINNGRIVEGKTYPISDIFRKAGYTWNRENQNWEK